MHYPRKNNHQYKIIFASTPDQPFFNELWNEYTIKSASKMGFNITLINETEESAARHWTELLQDADAIITTWKSPRIDEKILCRNNKLKIVGHAAGSVANYVSEELFERGITVTSSNSDMAHAVAEWCLMAGLMGVRKVMNYIRIAGCGDICWPRRYQCGSLKNAVIGIWGYGEIAAHLHRMLRPLEPCKVLICSNHLSENEAAELNAEKRSLEQVCRESDVIFLLNGLNEKTRGRIDRQLLASIKDGAVLVNGGRGELVEEASLLNELRKDRFVGVFDVFHREPLPSDSPLLDLPNVILTPHNAGYPSRNSYISTILEEFDRFFRGEDLQHQILPEKVQYMTVNNVG